MSRPSWDGCGNREFQASAPNEKWLTDITEFHIRAGKVYLSPIIDCLKGLVIRWTIGTKPDANLVNTMLDAAVETIADSDARPIIHSDRGGPLSLAWLDGAYKYSKARSLDVTKGKFARQRRM